MIIGRERERGEVSERKKEERAREDKERECGKRRAGKKKKKKKKLLYLFPHHGDVREAATEIAPPADDGAGGPDDGD